MSAYARRSNCAAGVAPPWQPAQYVATNGLTISVKPRSRSASVGCDACAPRPRVMPSTTQRVIANRISGARLEEQRRNLVQVSPPHHPSVGAVGGAERVCDLVIGEELRKAFRRREGPVAGAAPHPQQSQCLVGVDRLRNRLGVGRRKIFSAPETRAETADVAEPVEVIEADRQR